MSLWTVQQHEWLRALGHPVLLLAGDPSLAATPEGVAEPARSAAQRDTIPSPFPGRPVAGGSAASTADASPSRGDDGTGESAAPRVSPPAIPLASPVAGVDAGAQPPTVRADASTKKAALEAARGARRSIHRAVTLLPSDDPLLQAIVRASGLDAGAFEAAAHDWQLDLARIRAEPLAKRALWQQMRGKGRKPAR